jgi:hypothetical protein
MHAWARIRKTACMSLLSKCRLRLLVSLQMHSTQNTHTHTHTCALLKTEASLCRAKHAFIYTNLWLVMYTRARCMNLRGECNLGLLALKIDNANEAEHLKTHVKHTSNYCLQSQTTREIWIRGRPEHSLCMCTRLCVCVMCVCYIHGLLL